MVVVGKYFDDAYNCSLIICNMQTTVALTQGVVILKETFGKSMLLSSYESQRAHVPPVGSVRFVLYPPQNQCFLQRSLKECEFNFHDVRINDWFMFLMNELCYFNINFLKIK